MPEIITLNELRRKSRQVKGEWRLDDRHRLNYKSEDEGEEFELETSFVAAEPEALVFSITEKQENGKTVTGLAKLQGAWRANDQNQIEFEVTRQSGKNDVLTFTGRWKVGANHEIIYSYRTRPLKTRNSKLQALVFKGWWDITEKNRLTYLLEGESDSAFRFRGTFQTPSILAKKGELHYQLGVEAEGKQEKFQTITLFGKWKLSNALELSFEIEYPQGERREIRFGAEYALTRDFTVAAKLMNKEGDPLGVEVILTREFLEGHAQAFVRLKKSLAESAVEAGITIPW